MKKYIVFLIAVIVFMSCENAEDIKSDIKGLKEERKVLSQQVDELRNQETILQKEDRTLAEDVKVEEWIKNNHKIKYIVKFNLQQSHMSLDIKKHITDAMNAIEIEMPVDRDYYNSLKEGDEVVDEFRFGSLLLKGSLGSWDMSVISKRIEYIQ